MIDHANFTGYQQAIIETTKNATGQTTRISYTYGLDEITKTPPSAIHHRRAYIFRHTHFRIRRLRFNTHPLRFEQIRMNCDAFLTEEELWQENGGKKMKC